VASIALDGLAAEMTLTDHLEELRRRLLVCAMAILVTTGLSFASYPSLLRLLLSPLPSGATRLSGLVGSDRIAITGVGEGFAVVLKIAFAAGVALAAPVWLYQWWAFVSPALTRRERRHALPFTLVGVALFLVGVSVGFVTLRYPMDWLLRFGQPYFVPVITADSYFTFVAYFLLAFGVTFELPVVLTFLALVGVLSSRTLSTKRTEMLFGLWIASCFLTPGADPYSPVILGSAFTFLYFVSEGLIRSIGR
jgi:sec-independent protein translocase protein TatC